MEALNPPAVWAVCKEEEEGERRRATGPCRVTKMIPINNETTEGIT